MSKPLINDFTYFEAFGCLGNLGYECKIALKMSYFFGA